MHERLRKAEEVQKVFLKGRSLCFRDVCVRWMQNGRKCSRVAFLCGKKALPLAVSRNSMRRRLRESVRARTKEVVFGTDAVFLFRGKDVISFQKTQEEVDILLKKANLLKQNND